MADIDGAISPAEAATDKPRPAACRPGAYRRPRDPPPAAAPGPELGEAARLAQLLGLPPPTAGAVSGGAPSEYQANLTPEEIARFSAHVQSCWTSPVGLVNAPKLEVVI